MEIVNVDYNTKFNITDAKRKQSGTYKIIATNQHGKDEAEVEIVILCEYYVDLLYQSSLNGVLLVGISLNISDISNYIFVSNSLLSHLFLYAYGK